MTSRDSELIEIRRQRVAGGRDEPLEELAAHVMAVAERAKGSKAAEKSVSSALRALVNQSSAAAGVQAILRRERDAQAVLVAGLGELANLAVSISHDSDLIGGPIIEPNPLARLVSRARSYVVEAKILHSNFLAPLRGYEESLKIFAGEVAVEPEQETWRPKTQGDMLWTVEEVVHLMERVVIFVEPDYWWARGVGAR